MEMRFQNIDRLVRYFTCENICLLNMFFVDCLSCAVAGKGDREMHLRGMQEAMMNDMICFQT